MSEKGTLFLIPSVITENTVEAAIPPANLEIIRALDYFIVEEERTTRRFLRSIGFNRSFDEIVLHKLNKHTSVQDVLELISPLTSGKNAGLLSEAGCPCIADPGAQIVSLCQSNQIRVKPLSGPSSIILALMASGFNGQNFAFNGYLPVDKNLRRKKIKELEIRATRENQTQIFMETPYRNNQLLQDILQVCSPQTMLCIASEIMSENETIRTCTITEWVNHLPQIEKKTVIFLIGKNQ